MGDLEKIKIKKIKKTGEDYFIEDFEEIEDEEKAEDEDTVSSDLKIILVMAILIGGLVLATFGGFSLYNNLTSANVVTIDLLHQENLEGKLDEDEGYTYNGYSFVNIDGLWWTETNKFGVRLKIPLHFGPRELEEISLEGNLDPLFNFGEEVYVAIDPYVVNKYYTLAISEFSFNLVKGMERIPVGSCTEESPDCGNRTIINCETTEGRPVVELAFQYDAKPRIDFRGTCVKISGGDDYGIVKAVDRLLYEWYGIMKVG